MASNWDKVDAYVNGPADYEEIPELTEEDFARGTLMMNGKPVRAGRAASDGAMEHVSLHLDTAVIEGFRATGSGWEARINDVLREWLGRQAA